MVFLPFLFLTLIQFELCCQAMGGDVSLMRHGGAIEEALTPAESTECMKQFRMPNYHAHPCQR